MRLLVTGGAGFIGSEFVRSTLSEHAADQVTVLDKLTYAGNLANLESVAGDTRFQFIQGDIADPAVVERALRGCDAVVNFAAETHVDRSILEPDAFVKTDVVGTWTLAEAARAARVQRFVQVSTDEVYGAVLSGASVETDRLDPTSPYSASKAGGELLVMAAVKTYGLPALVVRGANAYGPYQYPEKLIPLHITNAIDDQPLPVYGDGQQRRQWTHVADFATGIDAVLRNGVIGEIYNVGNPEPEDSLLVNLDVSRRILSLLGKSETLLQHVVDRPAHDRRYRVDASKLVALGWKPRWTFADGLEQTVRWYAEHQEWWRSIKSGETHQTYYARNYADRSAFAR
ncbi:MAG: dTDP-glucose 4,6-dehydratase [Chloroflexi bacterium]|nr:dTDP-glucose 4,6-dehydratase [Chloroflexota bacterium]MBV9896225.1 dTDP-glucose 4,6-dehydratase [Chloroflexota bacterium]